MKMKIITNCLQGQIAVISVSVLLFIFDEAFDLHSQVNATWKLQQPMIGILHALYI